MKFSCDRCGQKYFSVDEPVDGQRYSVPCVVCGGAVLVKGGDFPALPTIAVDPVTHLGQAGIPDATGEEPLGLALAPAARPEPPPTPKRPRPRIRRLRVFPRRSGVGRSIAIVLATATAGILVFVGVQRLLSGPGPVTGARAGVESPVARVPAGNADLSPPAEPRASSSRPMPAAAAPASLVRRAPPPFPRAGSPAAGSGTPAEAAGAARRTATAPTRASSARPDPERVAAAIAAKRSEIDDCFREAQKGEPDLRIGRGPFHLRLTVNPDGIVTETEIDDPAMQNAVLGACVRAVARGLVFPMFEGAPVQMQVPFAPGGR